VDYVIHRRRSEKPFLYLFRYRILLAVRVLFPQFPTFFTHPTSLRVFSTQTISVLHDTAITLLHVPLWNYIYRELTRLKRLRRYWVLLKRDKRKFANYFETLFMKNLFRFFFTNFFIGFIYEIIGSIKFVIKNSLIKSLPFIFIVFFIEALYLISVPFARCKFLILIFNFTQSNLLMNSNFLKIYTFDSKYLNTSTCWYFQC